MPVGLPKVSLDVLSEDEEDFTDLDVFNRLYRQRVLFLGQEVDDETVNQIIAIMLFLTSEDEDRHILLYINSPGGSLTAGLSLFDMMQHLSPPIHTICMGMAASMASLILAGGEEQHRIALPHSRIMIHQPSSTYFEGQSIDCMTESDELARLQHMVLEAYVERTNQTAERLEADMVRDLFMSAEEAQSYGIVDEVAIEMDETYETYETYGTYEMDHDPFV